MNLIPAPPTPALSTASVKCNSILTLILPKSGFPDFVQSALLTTECSLLRAGGAQSLPVHLPTAAVQERNRQGCSSHLLWDISLSTGEITKEKPILSIHPHLKQVPAKPRSPNPLAMRGTPTITENKTLKLQGILAQFPHHLIKAPLAQYIQLLPQEVTKMIV